MIKLLIGGSPCTYWSIAQKGNRKKSKHSGAVERLRNLVIERKALAEIHPDTDCFVKDAQAIEYAVNVLEAMAV